MMPTLKDWLKRGAKRPKAKKRIRPVSPKRAKEMKEYAKKRKAFLRGHPKCEVFFPWIGPVSMFEMPICTKIAEDVHHKSGRLGGNYLNVSTWLPVCRSCHTWIHTNPAKARSVGLLA